MATIELGDVTGAPPPDPAERRLDRRRLRPAGLVLALLALLCCGAATTTGPPGVRPLWSGPLRPEPLIDVTTDTVYVQGPGELVAYDLADGRVRWKRADNRLSAFHSTLNGGPVLATANVPEQVTIALHPDTGAEMWRRPGAVRLEAGGDESALLVGSGSGGAPARLSRVRLADGQPLWTILAPDMQETILDDAADRVVFTTARGDVVVLRYSDGTRLASRRIDGVAPDEAGLVHVSIGLDNGRLVLFHSELEASWSTVLDVSTLRELYRTTPADGPVSGCGAVYCRFDRGGFTAVDPATGRVLWREAPLVGVSLVTDDRVLLDLSDGRQHVLADSRTGDPLAGGLRGVAVLSRAAPGSFLLLRPPAGLGAGRTAVSRVELATGATHLLGALPTVPDPQSCQAAPGYLVCPLAERFVVAAVPR